MRGGEGEREREGVRWLEKLKGKMRLRLFENRIVLWEGGGAGGGGAKSPTITQYPLHIQAVVWIGVFFL